MDITIYVFRRPNMFKVQSNYYNLIGYQELVNLFEIENYKTSQESLTLYYPERFLNVLEQRALVERIEKAGYKEVVIVTSTVYIIQTVDSKNIKIMNDENIPESEKRFKLSNDYSGLPDDTGLNVL